MPTTEFHAMGSRIKVRVDGDPHVVWPVLRRVKGWFQDWETCLSRFIGESELCQLNLAAGKWVTVSQPLWEVLQAAWKSIEWTDGLVTPTILPFMELAGYDRSFEKMRRNKYSSEDHLLRESDESLSCFDWRKVEFDLTKHRIHLPVGMRLDLGGYGKGWAADQACQRLSGLGPTLVDAGGDIALSARLLETAPWMIAVSNLRDFKTPALDVNEANPEKLMNPGMVPFITSGPAGVATSGSGIRYWGGENRMHHLIDPRTGRPAETDLTQVSVLAETALKAEVAAKAAFLLGCQAARIWLEQNHLEGCLLRQDGEVILTT